MRTGTRLWRWTGLLGLLLLPLAGIAAECRTVAPERIAAAPSDFGKGLLWRIDGAGAAPSYLFGTFHTSDPRITTLPCPVQQAFDGATSYTMEVIMNGAGLVSMAEAMFFSDGKTLEDVLGAALYQEVVAILTQQDPAKARAVRHMKPWAVMMAFGGGGVGGGGLFLDMALQLRATRHDKPTYGLETMQEQIAVFNGMSLDDQVVLLRDALQSRHTQEHAMEELTAAYLARDLAAIAGLNDKYKPADLRVHAELMDRLLTARNRNMAERMRARLQEGSAFVAVGALHLPGDTGLLRLLTDAGYRVTRLY